MLDVGARYREEVTISRDTGMPDGAFDVLANLDSDTPNAPSVTKPLVKNLNMHGAFTLHDSEYAFGHVKASTRFGHVDPAWQPRHRRLDVLPSPARPPH